MIGGIKETQVGVCIWKSLYCTCHYIGGIKGEDQGHASGGNAGHGWDAGGPC